MCHTKKKKENISTCIDSVWFVRKDILLNVRLVLSALVDKESDPQTGRYTIRWIKKQYQGQHELCKYQY